MVRYNILYRGPLSSCNYACDYCPFAKRVESRAELAKDRAALERFVAWTGENSQDRLGVFFTPWGEALIRPWYQRALADLTRLDHVERVVIQTNLSCGLTWTEECQTSKLALWATFHPTETSLDRFVVKVRWLRERGVRLSVGVVGLREHFDAIRELRAALPDEVYLWINAYKRVSDYYSAAETRELETRDPYFPINNQRHASFQKPCQAGETSFTVDGEGVMRRCHFVGAAIGNIYSGDWRTQLRARVCPNADCSCHIGYVNLEHLRQDMIYGPNLLERIPVAWEERIKPISAITKTRKDENTKADQIGSRG
jgi:MoaA/NifB/PqqE/SkfB family radical SAM enzyme